MHASTPAASTIGQHPRLRAVNAFMATPQYIVVVSVLALLSNLFALELPIYGIYTLLAVYTCLFGDDLLPLAPIALCGYITPSRNNNPGLSTESVFSGWRGIFVLICGILMAAACLYRVIRDRRLFFGRKYKFLPGLLLLSCGYLLGGIGSDGYREKALRHLVFALLQAASLCLLYLLFAGGIRREKLRKDYFAWIGFCVGGVLLTELLWIYLQPNTVVAGVIHRENIYTGWGIHNNLGGMLVMMIPSAFYLATKYRRGWLGTAFGSVFLLGVILSCSRNAMLTGTAVYFVSLVLMLYYARNKKGNVIAALICIGCASITVILFSQYILRLFSNILSLGFDPNSRDSIYRKGIELFKKYPIFGGSFFSPPELSPWGWSQSEAFTGFFPARWHNTFVQLIASCGIVGLLAYLPHRIQVMLVILRKHNKEKIFIGCAIAGLLICSLFDCHFFNIGPTLFYSAALAFVEHSNCTE